jgi:hypothetical protein
VSDGNAAHGSGESMMEKTKAVEQVFPQERNFAAAD